MITEDNHPRGGRPAGPSTSRHKAEPLPWVEDAACRNLDPGLFFDWEQIHGARQRQELDSALAVCAACPVARDCLEYALERNGTTTLYDAGVWGGTTPQDRHRIRRARARATRSLGQAPRPTTPEEPDVPREG